MLWVTFLNYHEGLNYNGCGKRLKAYRALGNISEIIIKVHTMTEMVVEKCLKANSALDYITEIIIKAHTMTVIVVEKCLIANID